MCSAMSEPLLAAQDLEKEYRIGPEVVRVLRGVTLAVNTGESVAVIGASGVGKSTLLHVLGTLDRPTGGRVLFGGEDVFARSDAGLRERSRPLRRRRRRGRRRRRRRWRGGQRRR